jgi:Holliday junction resolvase
MRRAAKVDGNHGEIVDGLRAHGVWVRSTAALGNGFPDAIAWWAGHYTVLEIKDPSQPPSKRMLTEQERTFFTLCPGRKAVVETLAEALRAVGRKP